MSRLQRGLSGLHGSANGGSRLGSFLDPVADKLFMACAFGVVLLSHSLSPLEILGVLARDLAAASADRAHDRDLDGVRSCGKFRKMPVEQRQIVGQIPVGNFAAGSHPDALMRGDVPEDRCRRVRTPVQ